MFVCILCPNFITQSAIWQKKLSHQHYSFVKQEKNLTSFGNVHVLRQNHGYRYKAFKLLTDITCTIVIVVAPLVFIL